MFLVTIYCYENYYETRVTCVFRYYHNMTLRYICCRTLFSNKCYIISILIKIIIRFRNLVNLKV